MTEDGKGDAAERNHSEIRRHAEQMLAIHDAGSEQSRWFGEANAQTARDILALLAEVERLTRENAALNDECIRWAGRTSDSYVDGLLRERNSARDLAERLTQENAKLLESEAEWQRREDRSIRAEALVERLTGERDAHAKDADTIAVIAEQRSDALSEMQLEVGRLSGLVAAARIALQDVQGIALNGPDPRKWSKDSPEVRLTAIDVRATAALAALREDGEGKPDPPADVTVGKRSWFQADV